MKRKFSKILGVGLTLSLLVSLLLSAAPVLASEVSQPTVALDEEVISIAEEYVITFVPGEQLNTDGDTITIRFPDDTDVPQGAIVNFTIAASQGWVNDTYQSVSPNLGAVTALGDEDDLTVTFTLPDVGKSDPQSIGEGSQVRIKFLKTALIINPTEPGTYTLEVKTEEDDDYAESVEYDIDAPEVGGFIYVYNPSDILMATFGGQDALAGVDTAGHFAGDDYTISVGPGDYLMPATDITISGEDLVFKSADGADVTGIDLDKNGAVGFIITGEGVTMTGFTLDDAGTAVTITGVDVTVTDCVITDADDVGVAISATALSNATVSNNEIEACPIGISFLEGGAQVNLDDVDIKGNTITEADGAGAIVLNGGQDDVDITDNTITANETSGIVFANGTYVSKDIDIKGNTITLNEGSGIVFAEDTDGDQATDVVITGNDISTNEGYALVAEEWDQAESYLSFNDIVDNDDGAIDNNDGTTGEVNAYFNWWGFDDEDDIEDELEGDVNFEPWLTDATGTITGGNYNASAGDATSLDAKDECGVGVTGIEDDTSPAIQAQIIAASKYEANPVDDLNDAIAFFDVYILLEDDFDITDINGKIKLYDSAITTGSVANFWTGDFWAECSEQEARDGIIYVVVSDDTLPALDELEETIFGVVAGEAEDALVTPVLLAPEVGAADVSLTPTFAWGAVTDADGYYFEFADNANYVFPLVSMTGDYGRLVVTAYAYMTELPYSTAYYWQVKAVSGTIEAGDLEESAWASSVFITKDEPEEETPPIVVEEAPPVVIKPIVEVITPAAEVITPAWIYVIIGVGAVLVIALLVLIVRTRRVA